MEGRNGNSEGDYNWIDEEDFNKREKKMSNREMLFRSVLRPGLSIPSADSPNLFSGDVSPMSSLALNFQQTASLTNSTPRRKLSLNSNISDSPLSNFNVSLQSSTSILHESTSSSSSDVYEDVSAALLSPSRKTLIPREKENFPSPCNNEENSTLMSPPPPAIATILSPSRKVMVRNKENFPSPYFSPSHSSHIPRRQRSSPLKEVQNTVNRNLTFSPMKRLQMISPTKRVLASPHKPSPPEDFDTNSQDSGYSESGKKFEDTCFSVPVSCAPRKLNLDLSPPKIQTTNLSSTRTITSTTTTALTVLSSRTNSISKVDDRKMFRRFSSLSKGDEEDSMLMDLLDNSPNQDDQHPQGLSSLLSAPIQKQSTTFQASSISTRPTIKRCLSMMDVTPTSSRVECITSSSSGHLTRCGRFKRPEAPTDLSNHVECKKRREDNCCTPLSPLDANALPSTPLTQRQASAPETSCSEVPKPKIVRSHSESHVSIMKALNKCSNHNGELTGDFSKPIALPTIEGGKHPDLKAISVDTMSNLLRGKYKDQIASFKIVDCRYPYEFEGGHIMGADMFHHPKMIIDHLMSQKGAPVIGKEGTPRHILIFHCEFSAERGPKAQRLLRETDRATNKEHYPALHFPETYLLEGGYKAFFEKYPELCTPQRYVRMLDANHAEDLKHFRGKSKSWQAENKQSKNRSTLPRTGLKRLGL